MSPASTTTAACCSSRCVVGSALSRSRRRTDLTPALLPCQTSNYGEDSIPLALEFGADWNVQNATVEILASDNMTAWNAPNVEAPVVPKLASVDLYDGKLSYELPA